MKTAMKCFNLQVFVTFGISAFLSISSYYGSYVEGELITSVYFNIS